VMLRVARQACRIPAAEQQSAVVHPRSSLAERPVMLYEVEIARFEIATRWCFWWYEDRAEPGKVKSPQSTRHRSAIQLTADATSL
jgi:hypothetical protein